MISLTIKIETDTDLIACRREADRLALKMGFTEIDRVRIVTAVSEIVRNVIAYAHKGQMIVQADGDWIKIIVEDRGPGIRDIDQAMRDGHGAAGSLGLGLGGSKRLMDLFRIESVVGHGTRIEMSKCLHRV